MKRRHDTKWLMRTRGNGGERVTHVELFFDLVYVFAVTQLSHRLIDHLSIHGALQTLILLMAVWWAWMYTTWFTNWFDPSRPSVRLVLIGIMLGSLVMSTAIPTAFEDRALVFAGAYVAMQVGRNLWGILALAHDRTLRSSFQRITAWSLAAGALWIAGALADGTMRELIWIAALVVDYAGPAVGYVTPGLGRSTTQDWSIMGEHMAERCQLFMIVALGESIIVTGSTYADLPFSASVTAAFVAAFVGSVAVWWIYFAHNAELSTHVIEESNDPGRLGRSAYTYFHVPMVAGIIVAAVGDELTIAHSTGSADAATVWTLLGGVGLFLAGHALFLRVILDRWHWPRLIAVALLLAMIPFGSRLSPLQVAFVALAIVVALAAVDSWQIRDLQKEVAEAASSR